MWIACWTAGCLIVTCHQLEIHLPFWPCISPDAGGMLSRARALRHVVASISKLAPEVIQGAEACSTSSCPCSCREAWLPSTASSGHGFATLPPDYARMRLNYPKRRAPVPGTAVQEAPDEGGTPIPANQATPLQGGARAGGSSRSLMAWQACCWLCCFGCLLCYIKSFDSSMLGRMSKLLLSRGFLSVAGVRPAGVGSNMCCSAGRGSARNC